jgi:Tfp pilus assembly protein PilN
MIKINLIPPEYAEAQAKKEQQILFGTIGSFSAVLLFLFWLVKSRQAASLESKIQEAEGELNKFQSIVSQIERIEADKQQLSSKRDVIRNLNRSRLVYPVFFEDILPIIPSDVWLLSVRLTETGSQMKLDMSANATSNFALATWLTNLQQSQHFSSVNLSPISYTSNELGIQTLSFQIDCIYQHKGPFPLSEFN